MISQSLYRYTIDGSTSEYMLRERGLNDYENDNIISLDSTFDTIRKYAPTRWNYDVLICFEI